MKQFIEQLRKTIDDYTDPFMDEKAFIDEARLQPGYRYNEALAQAICQSACMVVVYVPRYERHSYCLREFKAMELIESNRLMTFGQQRFQNLRMIIPIILRADDEEGVPPIIQDYIQYCNFTKYTTADMDLSKNLTYVTQIEQIARSINRILRAMQEPDPCTQCAEFRLPAIEGVPAWRVPPFPGTGL